MQMICGFRTLSEIGLRPNSSLARARTVSLSTNSEYTKVLTPVLSEDVLIETNLLGTAHGFASRPDLESLEVKTAFAGALVQIVDWFKKTL